jgi:hypothetical protein
MLKCVDCGKEFDTSQLTCADSALKADECQVHSDCIETYCDPCWED